METNPFHKADVVIGGIYSAKISGKLCEVRIDSKGHRSGWAATNMTTGREIHIKSAAKLRRRIDVPSSHPIVEKMRKTLTDAAAMENFSASHPNINLDTE